MTKIGIPKEIHPGEKRVAATPQTILKLRKLGFDVKVEVELPVIYESVRIDLGYRIDLLVNNLVIVELKCVEKILPVHEAQIISYIRMCKKNVGLLINFHVPVLSMGIKRIVWGFDR